MDASLPAKRIYRKRGYKETEYNTVKTDNGDYLCYDVMRLDDYLLILLTNRYLQYGQLC